MIAFGVRCLLVALFLPFSALDKILNFSPAVHQAEEVIYRKWPATLLIIGGLGIEIIMPAAILSGIVDRLAALVLATYCIATALLWKRFWRVRSFDLRGKHADRTLYWDFLKNFALAGGLLLLAFGTDARTVQLFFAHPLASSHPYSAPRSKP
jgi:putative oxidoreductase